MFLAVLMTVMHPDQTTDFERLYKRYGPLVLRRCRQLLGSEQEANDTMQDIFVRMMEKGHVPEDKGLSSYFYQAATHASLNRIRSRTRRREEFDDSILAQIAAKGSAEAQWDARRLLQRIFGQTDALSAYIAVLHLFDGNTLEQVASEVSMSVSGVRKRLRAFKQLAAQTETDMHGGNEI